LRQLTGRVLTSADQLQFSNRTATDVEPLRKQLLLLAIWLFLFDIAARKLDLQIFIRDKALQPASQIHTPFEKLKSRKVELEKQMPVWMEIEKMEAQPQPRKETPVAAESSDYMQRLKEAKKRR